MVTSRLMLKNLGLLILLAGFSVTSNAQNVGINVPVPLGKLHVKGGADVPQLIIHAHSVQGNNHPLLLFRDYTGIDLLWLHTDSPSNVFLGKEAGMSNLASQGGGSNTFIGHTAGRQNSLGFGNTAIGNNALKNNTESSGNTAIGGSALTNSTGNENNAFGYLSLFNTITGEDNVGIGTNTLRTNNAGSNGVAIGNHSQEKITNTTTPWDNTNTSVGFKSLYGSENTSANTGIDNTAIGRETLFY